MPDNSYNAKVHTEQGGDKLIVSSGGVIDFESGSQLQIAEAQVTATAAELNKLAGATPTTAEINTLLNVLANVTLTPAAGASTVCDVTIALKDAAGNALAKAIALLIWLSDAATGAGLTATAASGTVQAAAGGGQDMGVLTAKKCLIAQTKTDGTYVLEITDTAKTGFYVCVQLPNGKVVVSAQLVTANYGA